MVGTTLGASARSRLDYATRRRSRRIAGVRCTGRLDEQQMNLLSGNRPVLDTLRNDKQLARAEGHTAVAQLDDEVPLEQNVYSRWMRPSRRMMAALAATSNAATVINHAPRGLFDVGTRIGASLSEEGRRPTSPVHQRSQVHSPAGA